MRSTQCESDTVPAPLLCLVLGAGVVSKVILLYKMMLFRFSFKAEWRSGCRNVKFGVWK